MTDDDFPRFAERMAVVADVLDASVTPSRFRGYFEALRDLSLDAVLQALTACLRTQVYFPKPADLRNLAEGTTEQRADAAWAAWRKAARVVGSYASLLVDDPALAETLTAMFGSWPGACALELSPEMWANKRKEFTRIYATYCGRDLTGARYLVGQIEASNVPGHPHPLGQISDGECWTVAKDQIHALKASLSAPRLTA